MNINTRKLSFIKFNNKEMNWVKFNGVTVYESWRELIKRGIPPLTINSKGEYLINYKIYGNTVGNKSVGNQTKNVYNYEEYPLTKGTYIIYKSGGAITPSSTSNYSATLDFIPIEPNTIYTLNYATGGNNPGIAFYSEANEDSYISGVKSNVGFTTPDGANFIRFSVPKTTDETTIQLEKGSAITDFVKYGFIIPIKSNEVVKEIFLKKPLATNDYIDYKNQMVVIDGTPTYMEIPNIPTIKGTTILEVDTTIQPSNMEVIYKGKSNLQ